MPSPRTTKKTASGFQYKQPRSRKKGFTVEQSKSDISAESDGVNLKFALAAAKVEQAHSQADVQQQGA